MTDVRSPLRALRAALFAAICSSLAAMGHSFTSGHDLPLLVLLPAVPVTAGCAWLAAGRRRGALSIGLGLLAMQGALHLFFGLAQTHRTTATTPTHHMASVDHTATAVPVEVGATGQSSATMLAAHLAAAAFCALWLAHGESAFFRLARTAAAFAFTPLRLLLAVVLLPERPRPAPVRRAPLVRRPTLLLGHTVVRRGPPHSWLSRATAPGAFV
ncbi:hypothetical protein ABZ348_20565 [Streptomyces sp. NPDC005963]|uniref:hypothetical protein n=1 Tax=Streptomyces sp. NPDC005963 TaxID=3156721 RepID=UPI0033DB22F3